MPAALQTFAFRPLLAAALVAASAAAAVTGAPALAQAQAGASAPAPTVRPEFATPLQAAQALLGQDKAGEALTKLGEAEALPNRTPHETWVLERTRAAAAQKLGDKALVIKSVEAALATGQGEPSEQLPLTEALVGLASDAKDHARVLRWSQRYEEMKGTNDAVRVMRIQSLVATGDEAAAKTALVQRLDAADGAGKPLPESHLRLLLSLQFKAKDAGSTRTLERLVAAYPRPEYWSDLIAAASREPGISDRTMLELYRLQRQVGALRDADMRAEMAQLALAAGQPGEALAVLGEAAALSDAQSKLRDQARRQADKDKADRNANEAAAKKAPDGSALADLGWSMVAAQPTKAEAPALEPGLVLIEQGVAKGGLKRAHEARLHLAIAQLAAGRKDAAKQTLAELGKAAGSSDPLAAPIRLWNLYAQAPAMLPTRQ